MSARQHAPPTTITLSLARSRSSWNGEDDYIVTQMDNHASVYVRAYQASETQKSTISGGYEVAFLFWTGEVVVFGQDCDWATIRYNVSDILTYQQEYKIGVDLVDESMKIYIDGHHTISYNMSATNCLAGSIGFKTFYRRVQMTRVLMIRQRLSYTHRPSLLQRYGSAQPHGRQHVDADSSRPRPRRLVIPIPPFLLELGTRAPPPYLIPSACLRLARYSRAMPPLARNRW